LYQQNQCGFLEKVDKENLFLLFDKLVSIYFTPFSNFNLLIFRNGKDSFIKSIFSLPLKGERRALVETKKKNHGWGGD
jgi:hypothetical protein